MDIQHLEQFCLPTKFGKCLAEGALFQTQAFTIYCKQTKPQIEPKTAELIAHANEHLELKGPLCFIPESGFLYLDLDNRFIYELFEILNYKGTEIPPYFTSSKTIGAHISVATSQETFPKSNIPHLNEKIDFSLTGAYFVKPENIAGIKRVWFLTVESPQLSNIRSQLGLSRKIEGREFHITFAFEKEFLTIEDILFLSETKESGIQIEIDSTKATKRKVHLMQKSLENRI